MGAVSGAAPCAPERGAPNVETSNSNTNKRQNIFREFKGPPKTQFPRTPMRGCQCLEGQIRSGGVKTQAD